LSLDFQEGMSYTVQPILPPLIWRASLQQASSEHNRDMWDRGYYGHHTPEGLMPFAQVQPFDNGFLAVGQNLGAGREYVSAEAVYCGWMIDAGIEGRGHRQTILHALANTFGANCSSREFSFYGTYWTADFGVSLDTTAHVTGVIYRDWNGNGLYDEGEGLANWKVRVIAQSPAAPVATVISHSPTAGQAYAAAANSPAEEPAFTAAYTTGGYALPVDSEGDYIVEAQSPSGESFYQTVGVEQSNVKVDFVVAAGTTGAVRSGGSSSGQRAGCALSGGGSVAWNLLASMGFLIVGLLVLRTGSRSAGR